MNPVDAADKWVIIGKTGSPWGVRGWIKVISFTEKTEDILNYPIWILRGQKKDLSVELEEGRLYGKGVVVKLKGFDAPEKARELTGLQVVIRRSALPPPGQNEYYWTDLEGLTVLDQNGHCLGKVAWMMETGSTDAMVVQNSQGEQTAIPWQLGTVVTRVSLETGEIFVDWDPL